MGKTLSLQRNFTVKYIKCYT